MPEINEIILKRIRSIRKSKRRSIHDCATILGLTRETYHGIEKGTTPMTLPELELLAIFFGENPSDIISDDQLSPSKSTFLKDEVRPQFLQIREKMLRALIAREREKRSVTLEDIQQATHIPLETLQEYEDGTAPLPIDDLAKICAFLEIPLDSLHEPIWPAKTETNNNRNNDDWQPEFSTTDPVGTSPGEDPYVDILQAFKMVPEQDQAFIAKYLLEKLRSL